MTFKQQLRTVAIFTKLSTRRFFRDKVAIFFGIMFPLGFLIVFGLFSNGNQQPSFNVAVLNQSTSQFSRSFTQQLTTGKVFKVDKNLKNLDQAKAKLSKNQIDGIIILPPTFGTLDATKGYPTGTAQLIYSQSSTGTGQTLSSVLSGTLNVINNKQAGNTQPLSVSSQALNDHQLSSFDYTFAGLLGFSIIGIGIFGPINVFPELKKQGILRRLHTTPIRVWQYFLATMFSQAITGIVSISVQFIVAISLFHLKVAGNYLEIIPFTILSIFMILGIGLAIGGWAKNERQAAPLSNLIVFPMLLLSGTFIPRFEMPLWLQHATNFLPLTPVIDGLRLLTTEGKHLTNLGPQLGLMAVWLVIIYAIAFRSFKWE